MKEKKCPYCDAVLSDQYKRPYDEDNEDELALGICVRCRVDAVNEG